MSLTENSEILSSLASVREDVWRHVEELDRYRAVKAIERTIAEFPALDDLTGSLTDIRDSMQQRLSETREYRALRAVEKMLPELTSVLVLLSERSDGARLQPPVAEEEAPAAVFASTPEDTTNVAPDVPAAVTDDAVEGLELMDVLEADETGASVAAQSGPSDEPEAVENRNDVANSITDDLDFQPAHREAADDSGAASPPAQPQTSPPSADDGAPASSLAYSLAQLMVQALVPPPAPPDGVDGEKIQANEPVLPTDHAATERAGRAA